MHHTEYLFEAAKILTEREQDYGAPEVCFHRIAAIASVTLNRTVTPFEVAQIHIATKLARAVETPGKADTWIDVINYVAFAGNFATAEEFNNAARAANDFDELEKRVAATALDDLPDSPDR